MATAPKQPPSQKLAKRRSPEELARDLNQLVEKKFAQMPPSERVKKHEEFIAALKGRRP